MPKVLGIHELEIKPGVDAATFERFLTEEALPALRLPGITVSFLKGDRGERSGRYLMVVQCDSVETRDRLFPAPDALGPEAQQMSEAHSAVFEKWVTLGTGPGGAGGSTYTDYVEVSTQ